MRIVAKIKAGAYKLNKNLDCLLLADYVTQGIKTLPDREFPIYRGTSRRQMVTYRINNRVAVIKGPEYLNVIERGLLPNRLQGLGAAAKGISKWARDKQISVYTGKLPQRKRINGKLRRRTGKELTELAYKRFGYMVARKHSKEGREGFRMFSRNVPELFRAYVKKYHVLSDA